MSQAKRLRDLPGLGPRSEQWLIDAGIDTVDKLFRKGAIESYLAVRSVRGNTSLNLLYALVGAIDGRNWTTVAHHDKTRLLMSLEGYQELEKVLKTPAAPLPTD